METHFDTQIVVRDLTEGILVPKTSENLSNRDFLGKSTEMKEALEQKNQQKKIISCRLDFAETVTAEKRTPPPQDVSRPNAESIAAMQRPSKIILKFFSTENRKNLLPI